MNHEATIATLNAQLDNCAQDLYEKDKRIADLERENARLDAALDEEIGNRDQYHEWADRLAAEIARYFGVDIGEHSNVNNPWEQAYEAVPAEASAPAVNQQKPLGWLRKWAFDGEKPRKEKGKWVAKFRLLPITQHQAFNDDVPLYAAPQAADTDKVRKAWAKDAETWGGALNEAACVFLEVCPEKSTMLFNHVKPALRAAILKYADKVAASMAAQAPVREVPDAWISVNDRLPECDMEKGSFGVEVMVWPQWGQHATLFYGCRITDKPSFYMHGTRIDGVEKWRPLPAAPVQQEGV